MMLSEKEFISDDIEINDNTKATSSKTLFNISSPSFRKRLELGEDVPFSNNFNNNVNNSNNIEKQQTETSSSSTTTTPRPSFIKAPSLPSLSFPIKKSSSVSDDVKEIESKLNANCKNGVERAMLYMLANRLNVKLLIGVLFVLSFLNSLKTLSFNQNILSIVLFLVQLYTNYHRKNIDMAMSYEETFKRLDGQEMQRMVVSLVLYTTRILFLPEHNMMFIPVLFLWFAGANKLYIYSTFHGLFPTFYTSFLYIMCACYHSYHEYILNGYSARFIGIIEQYTVMTGCVWMFSYYFINVTGYLKHKVDKLQDTRKRLESALDARSRFMAHISHEFRCPIMSSIGCLELLKETPLNEKQNDLVDTIVSSNSVLLL
ncbi:predicted protein [Naegleria gruberi]|uniref:Predicted protein n=1 Tax=Naegleria gruberi TaxID=5762 RepID=D2VLN2_NAEGR|nr:uncharacterized protein NAEGRDRAFT_69841 [Naegleria gruberi]EFC42336.1 predicted protein [Naegleria gruberi]|eukprot:XP_002675080.1 predicted protein [Naegleria gruberi strain NEG-M]